MKYRVNSQVDRIAKAVERHRYRVHQKSHIINHGFNNGMTAGPALLRLSRVVSA